MPSTTTAQIEAREFLLAVIARGETAATEALSRVALAGRASHPTFRGVWRAVLALSPSGFAAGVVADGYRVPWSGSRCPGGVPLVPQHLRLPRDSRARAPEVQRAVLDGEIARMRALGVVEVVPPEEPTAFSTIFAVPKANPGEFRPIWNGKTVNAAGVSSTPFRMTSLTEIRQLLPPGVWMTSLDVRKAFWHVAIHPDSRRLLGFCWGSERLRFRALPFGLATAPRALTKLLAPLVACIRDLLRVGATIYIDDLLLWSSDPVHLAWATTAAVTMLHASGIEVSEDKCVRDPTQSITYLGFIINTVSGTVSLPPPKRRALRRLVRSWVTLLARPGATTTPLALARLAGTLVAASPAVPLAKLFTARILRARTAALAEHGWYASVAAPTEIAFDLEFWLAATKAGSPHARAPMVPPDPTWLMETDASGAGWGAVLRRLPPGTAPDTIPPRRTEIPIVQRAHGIWFPAEKTAMRSICEAETEAVTRAIDSFASTISGSAVLLLTDSIAAKSYVTRQRGRVLALETRGRRLWTAAQAARLTSLTALHLPGLENRDADFASRSRAPRIGDWRLCEATLRCATRAWGAVELDLFAAADNAHAPLYFAAEEDPGALGRDAFRHPWGAGRGLMLMHPPLSLLPRALAKFRREGGTAIAVLPVWPTRPWWTLAVELALAWRPIPADAIFPGPHMPATRTTRPASWTWVLALLAA